LKAEKMAYLANLADAISERLSQNLAEPLWNFAEVQRDQVILLEMRERAVFAVVVKDAHQQLVVAKTRGPAWEIIPTQAVITEHGMLRIQEIVKDKDTLGTVELYLTQRFIQAELYRQTRNLVITIVILDSTLLIFFVISLQRLLNRPIKRLLVVADAVAQGDFTQAIVFRQQDEMGRLANAFQQMVIRLTDVVRNVKTTAASVALSSQQMNKGATQLSLASARQAATAEEVSSTMEQIAANIRQNADNALQTEKIAIISAEDAEKTGTAVKQTVDAMNAIAENIQEIEKIANRTHMLSLNAAIEASKAQEYGKGFGVVAAEVRSLAERSGEAAQTINTLVQSSLAIAETAGEMLAHLVPNIQKTANLVQEISAASKEQKTGTEQINQAIQQLDQVIQQNASIAEETAATAEALTQKAQQLQETIGFFQIAERVEPVETKEIELNTLVDILHTLDQEALTKLSTVIGTLAHMKNSNTNATPRNMVPKKGGESDDEHVPNAHPQSPYNPAPTSSESSADDLDQEFEHF
jgi:methyl-accepting chemotaxis protein